MANCSGCKYYKVLPYPSCRRYPPTALLVPTPDGHGIQQAGMWPPVDDSLWCGEYQEDENASHDE